jgi:hypothetical protein
MTAHNSEECNILIKLMERKRHNILTFFIFSWPQREDRSHIPYVQVLSALPAPSTHGMSGQQYKLKHAVTHTYFKNFL